MHAAPDHISPRLSARLVRHFCMEAQCPLLLRLLMVWQDTFEDVSQQRQSGRIGATESNRAAPMSSPCAKHFSEFR